jgi:septal ring factor EnvC (AmiA/AmiB activator)
MDRLGVIRMVGDVITDVDVLRGSLLPRDPKRLLLDDFRILLDARQQRLSREAFDDNTAAFKSAAADLEQINTQLQDSVEKLEKLDATLKTIKSFIDSLTNLLSAVAVLV